MNFIKTRSGIIKAIAIVFAITLSPTVFAKPGFVGILSEFKDFRNPSAVLDIAFEGEEKVLIGYGSGEIISWDLRTGQRLNQVKKIINSDPIRILRISNQRTYLVVQSGVCTIRAFDTGLSSSSSSDGNLPLFEEDEVVDADFSSDGNKILLVKRIATQSNQSSSLSNENFQAEVFDLKDPSVRKTRLIPGEFKKARLSPNGEIVLVSTSNFRLNKHDRAQAALGVWYPNAPSEPVSSAESSSQKKITMTQAEQIQLMNKMQDFLESHGSVFPEQGVLESLQNENEEILANHFKRLLDTREIPQLKRHQEQEFQKKLLQHTERYGESGKFKFFHIKGAYKKPGSFLSLFFSPDSLSASAVWKEEGLHHFELHWIDLSGNAEAKTIQSTNDSMEAISVFNNRIWMMHRKTFQLLTVGSVDHEYGRFPQA